MKKEPVRILQMVGAMYPGGMENFIMNLYGHIDREKVQFDFAVHIRRENDYGPQIEEMGGHIYELPRLTRHPIKSLTTLKKLVKQNEYPVVIRHTANALVAPQLLIAKKAGAKTVCHSHNETDPKKFIHKLSRIILKKSADVRLACSPKAGKWMFDELDYRVIHNAIDIGKFSYSDEKAERIVKEFDLQDKHVFGHIANFIESKNHKYLLQIFKEITKRDDKAVLFCLGEGDLRSEIEAQIESLGLEGKVILTGIRHDAQDFMSAFDILIFPSLFEGLPLTLIEAQAAGLPIQMSDTITPDVIVTEGLVESMSIDIEPVAWAERILERYNESKGKTRDCQRESIAKHGYDVEELAMWYEQYVLELANK